MSARPRARHAAPLRNACAGEREISDRLLASALHVALRGSDQQLLDCIQLAFRVFREGDALHAPQPV